jgi:hypothetical protein
MDSPIEAVVYPEGNIRLFDHVHLPAPCRALVTILHEPPHPGAADRPVQDALQHPVTFGSRIIDLAAVEDMTDTGEHIQIVFESDHQPQVLLLYGDDAEAARQWMLANDWYWRNFEGELMSLGELERLEALVTAGKAPSLHDCGRLLAELRRTQANRGKYVHTLARTQQWLFHHLEEVQHAVVTNTVRTVRCTLGEGCDVRADGTCFHTDQLEGLW